MDVKRDQNFHKRAACLCHTRKDSFVAPGKVKVNSVVAYKSVFVSNESLVY